MSQSQQQEWTLLDEGGGTAVVFTSFIGMDLRSDGNALTYPVEQGSFADYNKVDSPQEIKVTLGLQGAEADFEAALAKLDEYQKEAVKLAVATPARHYDSMTLEGYAYSRSQERNAGMLAVELTLVEVREVETQVTTTVVTKPKNPTSASKENTGKAQPEAAEKRQSLSKYLELRSALTGGGS
ncbi:hypothetical protein LJC59_00340 [Desulfovibrio sp. OttesenSCG-928-A18]|nr:hypothetical protein [Desulfovibrio sp. OttesenSCG-928-A18]